MRIRAQLAAFAAGTVVLAGAGCGSDDEQGEPIPQTTATEIARLLDGVRQRYDAAQEPGKKGACDDIDRDSYPAIEDQIESLPADVDEDVRDALESSLDRLKELTSDGCSNIEDTTTEEETPEPTEPETVTETVPAPPETQTTPSEPPEEDDGTKTTPGGTVPPGQGGAGGTPAPSGDG